MGDPRKTRRKYQQPAHPWQKERIEKEKVLLREYGLNRKAEIWKISSKLKNFAGQAKRLIAARGKQAEKEKEQLMTKLANLGLINLEADLDDVLGLNIRNLMDRRLQTLVVKKGLARTYRQARQFITHRHIQLGNTAITSPSHIVRVKDEETIMFVSRSALASETHPERYVKPEPVEEKKEETEKTTDKPKKVVKKTAKKETSKEVKKEAPKKDKTEEVKTEKKETAKEEPKLAKKAAEKKADKPTPEKPKEEKPVAGKKEPEKKEAKPVEKKPEVKASKSDEKKPAKDVKEKPEAKE